ALPAEGAEPAPPAGTGRKSGWIELGRAQTLVHPQQEWTQMYEEAWRLQSEQFWDESMSNVDWKVVHDRYAAILKRVRTRAELSDIIWEMQGELGTSHAYEMGGDYRRIPAYYRGFLGADLVWNAKHKGYTVERIVRGDSWADECDSPLAVPGADVAEGETIVAVNGREVNKEITPDELLLNNAAREVSLTVIDKKGERRNVVTKTLRNEVMLRYRNWVERNRKLVHERTNGKVGYVHIPDMGPFGFAEFHRGYLTEVHRDGLIVDARYNRGGHVSPLLLEKLARKRSGYDISRWGVPMPYPPESVAGPMVCLTNQFAGSDGDIFSHCFKLYQLGPLVGKRTWGGVIGIWPRHRLVDGTITTQPEYSFWFKDVGWKVENYGTDPDFD
ncbi:MAG: PDZ domain-containing protein, partial [Terriglobales bacterium]